MDGKRSEKAAKRIKAFFMLPQPTVCAEKA
jgi:hypothetical protein